MTTSSPRKSKKQRRRHSSGNQDAVLASVRDPERPQDQERHTLHVFPSAPGLGKGDKPPTKSSPDPPSREQHPAHIYDRPYYTDGSNRDMEGDWRRELLRRARSTSDVSDGNVPDGFRFQGRSRSPPAAYASLPATPTLSLKPYEENGISHPRNTLPDALGPQTPNLEPAPPPRNRQMSQDSKVYDPAPFSLWDYLREELLATDFDSHQELKWERVSNFLNIPFAMEKVNLVASYTSDICSLNELSDHRIWLYSLLG